MIKLGDLISLGQVWIEIIFAIKVRFIRNATAECEPCANAKTYGLHVYSRKRTWLTGADMTDGCVGRFAVIDVRASAEHLTFGFESDVDFQADNRNQAHSKTVDCKM